MSFEQRAITGIALRDGDGSRLAGVLVRVRGQGQAILAETVTRSDGAFQLSVQQPDVDVLYEIEFVSEGGVLCVTGGQTSFVARDFPTRATYRIFLPAKPQRIDDATPAQPVSSGSVRGVVTHINGRPVPGATVRVYHKSVGAQSLLAETTTGTDGGYAASYTYPTPAPNVFAVAVDAQDEIRARSELQLAAPPHLVLHLAAEGDGLWGVALFEVIDAALTSDLAGVSLSTLSASDVVFLSEKHGIELAMVRRYLAAQRLTELVTPSAQALFGLLCAGLPRSASQLTALPEQAVTNALEGAASRHLIDQSIADDAQSVADDLRADAISLTLGATTPTSLGTLLTTAAPSLTTTQREILVGARFAVGASPTDFWDTITASPAFSAPAVDAAKRASKLGTLAGGHVPLVAAFDATYTAPATQKAAELTTADWRALLDLQVSGVDVGAPAWIEGASESERRDAYADWLAARAERAYPSAVVAARLRADDPGDTTDLSKFLRDNPAIDLGRAQISSFVDAGDTSAVVDVPALKTRLHTLQRLYRVAPQIGRHAVVNELEAAQIGSASQIVRMGRTRFVARMGAAVGGPAAANQIFQRAASVHAGAVTAYARFKGLPGLDSPFLPHLDTSGASAIDGFAELFGAQSCSCRACTSVLSPAAYLADLLHWLDARYLDTEPEPPALDPPSLYEHLTLRRPDLGLLELTCANAETSMPYADLAIEIFEVAVVNLTSGPGTATVPVRTTHTTEELLAQPEYELSEAYDVLIAAQYPTVFPYHHQLEQVRAAFRHVGIDFVEFLEHFRGPLGPSDTEIDVARLGGFPQWTTIVTDTGNTSAHLYWGYSTTSGITHPDTERTDDLVDWWVALRYVPELLARAQLEDPAEDLLDLLHTRFVLGPGAFALVTDAPGSCDLADYYVGEVYVDGGTPAAQPTASAFMRITALLRLQRRLGWTWLDLDKALAAFGVVPTSGNTGLTTEVLRELARTLEVLERTGEHDLPSVLSWWTAQLDTFLDRDDKDAPVPPLYDRLFLDPSLVADPASSAFELNSTRDALLDEAPDLLANHEPELLAALRTTSTELRDAEVVAQEQLSISTPLDRSLTHISWLYRIIATAKASELSVHEAHRFALAVGAAPYAGPAAAVAWFDQLDQLDPLGLTVRDLLWICAHDTVVSADLAPTEDESRAFLGALRDQLRALQADAESAVALLEVDTGRLRTKLGSLVADPAVIDELVAIIEGWYDDASLDAAPKIEAHLGTFVDLVAVQAALFPVPGPPADELVAAPRRKALYDLVEQGLLQLGLQAGVVAAISEQFGLSSALAQQLAAVPFDALGAPGTATFLTTLTDTAFLDPGLDETDKAPWDDLSPGTDASAFAVVHLAAKVARLVTALALSPELLSWWQDHASQLGLLALSSLPVAEDLVDLPTRWAGLRLVGRLATLDRPTVTAEPAWASLLDTLASGAVASYAEAWATRSGWARTDVDAAVVLRQAGGVTFTEPGDLTGSSAPVEIVVAGTPVSAVPGGTWASTDAAMVALRDAVNADLTVGPLVGAVCLDASGSVTAGGSPAAVSVRLSLEAGQTALLDMTATTSTLQVVPAALNADLLAEVLRSLQIARALGTSVSKAAGWATTDPSGIAEEVRLAIRGKYTTTSAWSAAWRNVRDEVRRKQQDALVRWLHANDPGAPTEEALHGHYLIDPGMDPCFLTSRMVQALASVQLFVQRALMGLEAAEVVLDEESAEQWTWMRQYRVWEAARKVFLYPEIWTEPEFRKDKTALFEQLEREVVGVDIDEDNVREAATTYADELLTLANLEIVAMYFEADDSSTAPMAGTTHLVARTRSESPRWYYRSFGGIGRWTAWEPVELDIGDRQVAPAVFGGRLVLLWAEIAPKDALTVDVTVHYSYRKDGAWQAAEQYGPVAVSNLPKPNLLPSRFYLSVRPDELSVDLGVGQAYEDDVLVLRLTLNPCTWEFQSVADGTRILDRTLNAPLQCYTNYQGFIPLQVSGVPQTSTIDVRIGSVGSALHAECTRLYLPDTRVVFPRQALSFRCQYPFAIQDGERCYLIETLDTESSIEGTLQQDLPDMLEGSRFFAEMQSQDDEDSELQIAMNFAARQQVPDGGYDVVVHEQAEIGPPEGTGWARFLPHTMHHPYACLIAEQLHLHGIDALLDPEPADPVAGVGNLLFQAKNDLDQSGLSTFVREYATPNIVAHESPEPAYPLDEFDFRFGSAQGTYNWELFFHMSWFIAARLRDNGRYEQALNWLHYLFDPRKVSDPWRVKPLREASNQPIEDWLAQMSGKQSGTLSAAVEAWQDDPFDPHRVAQMRPEAYKRAIFQRYLEVVLDWADSRFAVDTLESINEAVQLYLYARDILGPRPATLPAESEPTPQSYEGLRDDLDAFSNAIVSLENMLPMGRPPKRRPHAQSKRASRPATVFSPTASYFCIPRNDVLELSRDRIDDRLFKIRNCMNIDGIVRALPLFQPPIDPGQLVRASAAGLDLGSVVNQLGVLPRYRFAAVLGRAKELAGSVSQLGGAMLSAMEKQDAEALALLRETQERTLLDLVTEVKQAQLEEAQHSHGAAIEAREVAIQRRDYYQSLIDKDLLPAEKKADRAFKKSNELSAKAARAENGAAKAARFADISASVGLPPSVSATIGGSLVSSQFRADASSHRTKADGHSRELSTAERQAGRTRRTQEWKQQVKSADKELGQHDKQIEAAAVRIEIARRELRNHGRQIAHARERLDLLKTKFTRRELYTWMVSSLAQIHAAAYQQALEVARQAEAAYRYELAVDDTNFVQWTNWDSLRKGLLAGERLSFDLQRMERAYYDNDRRELEVTKHVSLAQLDPSALVKLQQERSCKFVLPEVLFDMDFPGHYLRRLKSVSISMPCVAGPYGGVNATLRLESSRTRTTPSLAAALQENLNIESIAVSGASDETGVFNFDLTGPRLMPFERRGVMGNWSLELTGKHSAFDPGSIRDVILRLQYTARDGGSVFRTAVDGQLEGALSALQSASAEDVAGEVVPGLQHVVSAKHDFPDAFHALLYPTNTTVAFEVALLREHFPHALHDLDLEINGFSVIALAKSAAGAPAGTATVSVTLGAYGPQDHELADTTSDPPGHVAVTHLASLSTFAPSQPSLAVSLDFVPADLANTGLQTVAGDQLDPDKLEDLLLVLYYTVAVPS